MGLLYDKSPLYSYDFTRNILCKIIYPTPLFLETINIHSSFYFFFKTFF